MINSTPTKKLTTTSINPSMNRSIGRDSFHDSPRPKYMGSNGVEAYRNMPISFGKVVATVYGGPFREYVPGQRRLVSVKMAEEIEAPNDISIPTKDFDVPSFPSMHAGVRKALVAILAGNDLYVGCMGGIGRTGLFMACLAKIMLDHSGSKITGFASGTGAVKYVRSNYLAHAVETQAQQTYVNNFETSTHIEFLKSELDPPEVRVVEVLRIVKVYSFNPFAALKNVFSSPKS